MLPATEKTPINNKFIQRRGSKKAKIIAAVALLVACIIVGITLGIVLPKVLNESKSESEPFQSILGNFSTAAITTDAAQCAAIGKDILMINGSAVDSAIATLLCMSVVIPQSMGLGGGFLMTIYIRKNSTAFVLDARETAPSGATEEMFDARGNASIFGGLSVAVPGEIHGMYSAHKEFGKLPWEELFKPAINISRNGFPVGEHLARAIESIRKTIENKEIQLFDAPGGNASSLSFLNEWKDQFTNSETKTYFKEGEILKRTKFADTLETLSKTYPPDIFYKGNIATNLVKEITDAGGIITIEDMENYKSRWLKPIQVRLDNMTLYSFPPPGSGALLAFILNIMDGYKYSSSSLETEDDKVKFYHRIIESFKFAYAKRMEMEDNDSNEIINLVKLLTNETFAEETRQKINDSTTYGPKYYGVTALAENDHGTAHMCVVAANGDAVSVTSTVNLYFGSLVVSPSTGIVLNDEMDDFSTNQTNNFGVPPTKFNRIHPGRRPMSSMAPTILVDADGDVRLAVGGNGGTYITSGIALVTARNLWLGENIKVAIDGPRVHDQVFPELTSYEKLFPKNLVEGLRNLGHNMELLKGWGSVILGIERGKDGNLYANSDYRKQGKVDGY